MCRQKILLLILYTIAILTLGFLLANDYGHYKYQFQSYFGSSYYLVQYQQLN